jgi:hypothetical protein
MMMMRSFGMGFWIRLRSLPNNLVMSLEVRPFCSFILN